MAFLAHLGPLLFLIFINDLSLNLKDIISSVDLYADDTTLYDIQASKGQIESTLQHALNLLHTLCLGNEMFLKWMLVTNRQKRRT